MTFPAAILALVDIDLTDEIDALPRQPGHRKLAEREAERYITLHYSGVAAGRYADRSETAELRRIIAEATEHLKRDWDPSAVRATYGDGYMYDFVVLSNGKIVRTRKRRQQLWHAGNGDANEQSWSVHVLCDNGQDLTDLQRDSLFRLFDALRALTNIPRSAVVGHNEWPREEGAPQPSATYRTLFRQSACPGRIIHKHLVAYRRLRAAATPKPAPATSYSEHSPILGAPLATQAHAIRFILDHPEFRKSTYKVFDIIQVIVPRYWELCAEVGVDPVIAVAQMIHETACLSSALSQRKDKDGRDLRNPAGIGVSEARSLATPHYRPGCVWDADVHDGRGGYRPCVQFKDWSTQSIPAQVGRLLAYALKPSARSQRQQVLVNLALGFRPLDLVAHGSATTLRQLGAIHNPANTGLPREKWRSGWAWDGLEYGENVGEVAERIRKVQL